LPFEPAASGEARFLAELDTIDEHHGGYSTATPYTELEVIGCRLSDPIRRALAELRFSEFADHDGGFLARRTPEDAALSGAD
jgi:hypothetical protein